MFIFRMAGTKGAVRVLPGTAGAEVNMTRTALRRRPPLSRADLHRRDEGELLALVTGEPVGSAVRSAACEILVRRWQIRVRRSAQDLLLRCSVPGGTHGTSRTETSQTETRRPA